MEPYQRVGELSNVHPSREAAPLSSRPIEHLSLSTGCLWRELQAANSSLMERGSEKPAKGKKKRQVPWLSWTRGRHCSPWICFAAREGSVRQLQALLQQAACRR